MPVLEMPLRLWYFKLQFVIFKNLFIFLNAMRLWNQSLKYLRDLLFL